MLCNFDRENCWATDVLNRFTIIFVHYFSPIIEVVLKDTSLTYIVESVQIFEHLNDLPLKYSLYKANEFQVLERLLIAMVSDL